MKSLLDIMEEIYTGGIEYLTQLTGVIKTDTYRDTNVYYLDFKDIHPEMNIVLGFALHDNIVVNSEFMSNLRLPDNVDVSKYKDVILNNILSHEYIHTRQYLRYGHKEFADRVRDVDSNLLIEMEAYKYSITEQVGCKDAKEVTINGLEEEKIAYNFRDKTKEELYEAYDMV